MSRRGWFWTLYGASIALAVGALVAWAQTQLGGTGGIEPASGGAALGIPSDVTRQDAVVIYSFYSDPGTGAGFIIRQSTAIAFTDNAKAPRWQLAMSPDNGRFYQAQEEFQGQAAFNLQRNEGYRLLINAQGTGANAGTIDSSLIVQFIVSDSVLLTRNRIPTGFGVVLLGSSRTFGGIPAGQWAGFVGNGTDTTYVSLGAWNGVADAKLYIDAPNGGAVDFYLDGTLRASISSPARASSNDTRGFGFATSGASEGMVQELMFGPFTIQREWDN